MPRVELQLEEFDPAYRQQLLYGLAFVGDGVEKVEISDDASLLTIELDETADAAAIGEKARTLVARFTRSEFGMKESVYYENRRDLPVFDVWNEMLQRRWITPVGDGHVVLRDRAAALMDLIDRQIRTRFIPAFNAEIEIYPATIKCETLDRCNHFTSFPEHIDFVAHLRSDIEVLEQFSSGCGEKGWSPSLHDGRMDQVAYAISPSCCYHCYESMEGWELEAPGRCVTMVVGCHRYEGANQQTLSRLRAFNMREIVWVGHPKWVIESRAHIDGMIVDWAKEWELDCTYEAANDMFFTDDFSVKASFQRQQEAKKELRMRVPQENQDISVFSSNFHSATFGRAFEIKVNGRPAASACVGWGYERLVYALFSQFGFDLEKWPQVPREEFTRHLRELGLES